MREPSTAIMTTLPAEVLHFINDLKDEITSLQSHVRVLEVLGDKEVVASDVIYWKDRAVDAEKRAVEMESASIGFDLARDVIASF
jgi:hypothetical protein